MLYNRVPAVWTGAAEFLDSIHNRNAAVAEPHFVEVA
jgi:hypothetical protein